MSSLAGAPTTPTRPRPSASHSDTSTPTLTHSASNRSFDSPTPKSPIVNHHPVIPKNYHPYQIQTTSSSLLTRSNSSPNQPVHSISGHRTSRSMSNLAHTASPGGPGASASESESEEQDRRKSMDSPRPAAMAGEKPMMRRSGTLPSFPSLGEVKKEQKREADLPVSHPHLRIPLVSLHCSLIPRPGPVGQQSSIPLIRRPANSAQHPSWQAT